MPFFPPKNKTLTFGFIKVWVTIVLVACESAACQLSAGATELTNQQAASVSSQAAQAMQVLDLHFGAAACLEFLSELLPRDPFANAEEPARLTSAQVSF